MLLTRRVCYGLLAAQHLAEHACEGSFSANDLAEFYGLPHEALAKILQRLSTAGVLMSHHGIKGGYTLARDPRYISVFDVIKASQGSRWSSLHSERQQRLGTGNGYQPLRMVSQLVEDLCCASLRLRTSKKRPPVPPVSREMLHRCERRSLTTKPLGVTEARAVRKAFCTGVARETLHPECGSVGVHPHAAEGSLDARAAVSVCRLHPIKLWGDSLK